MNFPELLTKMNYLAVVVAAVSAFLIGAVWYGPLFGKAWQKENKLSDEDLKKRSLALVFGGAFVLTLITAFNLALFLGAEADLLFGIFAGLMTGLFFVCTFLGILYLFEGKSLKLFLINGGYTTLTLVVMGAIIGVWR